MKSPKTLFAIFCVCFLLFCATQSNCLISSYPTQSSLYNKAIESGDMEIYKEYLSIYPYGQHSLEIKNKIIDAETKLLESEWDKAIERNSIDGYNIFRFSKLFSDKNFIPDSIKKTYCKKAEENIAYLKALEENTINEYQYFLKIHPYGEHANKVKKDLSSLLDLELNKIIEQKSLKELCKFRDNYTGFLQDDLWVRLTSEIHKLEKIRKEREIKITLNCNLLPKYCELFENKLNDLQEKINDTFFDYKIEINGLGLDIDIESSALRIALFTLYNFESDTLRKPYSFNKENNLLLDVYLYREIVSKIHYTFLSIIKDNAHFKSNLVSNNINIIYQFSFCKNLDEYITFLGTSKQFSIYYMSCCTKKYGQQRISNAHDLSYSIVGNEQMGHNFNWFKRTSYLNQFKVPKPYSSLDGSLQTSANIYEYFGLEY